MTLDQLKRARLPYGPRVHNLVRIEGTLTTRTPLHVGSGAGDDEGNLNTVLLESPEIGGTTRDIDRQPNDGCYPYIPGTALRGVLRSHVSAMLSPFGAAVAAGAGLDPESIEKALRSASTPVERDRLRLERLQAELDLVAGVFGDTHWRSKIELDAARVSAPSRTRAPRDLVHRVTRVAIDHELRTADEGRLFDVELVRRGVAFEFSMRARNVRPWELALVLYGLSGFNHPVFPVRVGGYTNHGFGELTWEPGRVTVYGALSGDGARSTLIEDWVRGQSEPQHKATTYDRLRSDLAEPFAGLLAALEEGA